jgi:hypothetical protein
VDPITPGVAPPAARRNHVGVGMGIVSSPRVAARDRCRVPDVPRAMQSLSFEAFSVESLLL